MRLSNQAELPFTVDDPVAIRTEWTPLVPGGSNFVTHRLVALSPSLLAIHKSIWLRIFGMWFVILGSIVSTIGLTTRNWPVALFGLPFVIAGAVILRPKRLMFDSVKRLFAGEKLISFSAIHALQLLRERLSSNEGGPDFDSYELNVVLVTGERINLLDHAGGALVKEDARRLGAFIGCKVWDATAL